MRVSGARIVGALAAAALALAIAPGRAAKRSRSRSRCGRRVSSTRAGPAPAIARGFVGVSIDYCNITRYAQAGPNPILDQLLLALAPEGGVVRIGGDQIGQTCPPGDPDPLATTPPVIRAVLRQTQSHAILGLDFFDGNPYLVPGEVTTLVRALDPRHPSRWIDAFEVANEPDLYQRYGAGLPGSRRGRCSSTTCRRSPSGRGSCTGMRGIPPSASRARASGGSGSPGSTVRSRTTSARS